MENNEFSYLLGKSYKIDKSDKYSDYDNYILYLAPSDLSGFNVCPFASNGCIKSCLNTSGRGRMSNTQQARINRTLMYVNDKVKFFERLMNEIRIIYKRSPKVAIRLNGTSDINWIPMIKKITELFPGIIFYDYTKNPKIAIQALEIDNYFVTFSRSESNEDVCKELIKSHPDINIAVVFDSLPSEYWGRDVIDGDITDTRFLDEKGVIVGLSAKGKAKIDRSGFVVRRLKEIVVDNQNTSINVKRRNKANS